VSCSACTAVSFFPDCAATWFKNACIEPQAGQEGITWSDDGKTLVYAYRGMLARIPVVGGQAQTRLLTDATDRSQTGAHELSALATRNDRAGARSSSDPARTLQAINRTQLEA
jgi:hypothetical protein